MTKTKYKVLALTGFDGHKQGEEVEAELGEEDEARYIERGQIEPVKKSTTKKEAGSA